MPGPVAAASERNGEGIKWNRRGSAMSGRVVSCVRAPTEIIENCCTVDEKKNCYKCISGSKLPYRRAGQIIRCVVYYAQGVVISGISHPSAPPHRITPAARSLVIDLVLSLDTQLYVEWRDRRLWRRYLHLPAPPPLRIRIMHIPGSSCTG